MPNIAKNIDFRYTASELEKDKYLIEKQPLWRQKPHLFCTIAEMQKFVGETRTFLVKVVKGLLMKKDYDKNFLSLL